MPIYEYQCDDCGHRSEAIQRLADDRLTECGECGGTLKRLISAPAVQFKGTGWYVTDYGGRKASTEGSSASDSDKGSDKGSDKADSSETKASSEKSEGKPSSGGKKKAAGKSPKE